MYRGTSTDFATGSPPERSAGTGRLVYAVIPPLASPQMACRPHVDLGARQSRSGPTSLTGMNLFKRAVERIRNVCGTAVDAGMSTAEYAVGTLAAVAFAAVLYKVVTGDSVAGLLNGIVTKALSGF